VVDTRVQVENIVRTFFGRAPRTARDPIDNTGSRQIFRLITHYQYNFHILSQSL